LSPSESVGDACARPASTDQPIAHIADAVGYGTFADFNRQFKLLTSMTPREYRAHFRRAQAMPRQVRTSTSAASASYV
jgi:AraC-like DNA-binding protein